MNRKVANLSSEQLVTMKCIGYWWSQEQSELPHPRDFIDNGWDEKEKQKILKYISKCYYPPCASAGFSWCRMGCEPIPQDLGTQDLTDGTFIFPEGLAHYIAHHNVKPPEEFLSFIKQNNYNAPILKEIKEKYQ